MEGSLNKHYIQNIHILLSGSSSILGYILGKIAILWVLFCNSENFYVFWHGSILNKKSYSLTEFEWNECPRWQFLESKFELFQIKRVHAKKINNDPWLYLVLKGA